MRSSVAVAAAVVLFAAGALLSALVLPRWLAERMVTRLQACLAGEPLREGESGRERVQTIEARIDRRGGRASWPERCASVAQDVLRSGYIVRHDPELNSRATSLVVRLTSSDALDAAAAFLDRARGWRWVPEAAAQVPAPRLLPVPPAPKTSTFGGGFRSYRDLPGIQAIDADLLPQKKESGWSWYRVGSAPGSPLSPVACSPYALPAGALLAGGGGSLGPVFFIGDGLRSATGSFSAPRPAWPMDDLLVTPSGAVVTSALALDWRLDSLWSKALEPPQNMPEVASKGVPRDTVYWRQGGKRFSASASGRLSLVAGHALWDDERLTARKILDEPPGFGPEIALDLRPRGGATYREACRTNDGWAVLLAGYRSVSGPPPGESDDPNSLWLFFVGPDGWRGPIKLPAESAAGEAIFRQMLFCQEAQAYVASAHILCHGAPVSLRVARCTPGGCQLEAASAPALFSADVCKLGRFTSLRLTPLLVPLGEQAALLWMDRGYLRARIARPEALAEAEERLVMPETGADGRLRVLLHRGDAALVSFEEASAEGGRSHLLRVDPRSVEVVTCRDE